MFKSREFMNKCLSLCSDNFSSSNYIIGMIHYQLRDWQKCVDYIEKIIEIGLNSRFTEESYLQIRR